MSNLDLKMINIQEMNVNEMRDVDGGRSWILRFFGSLIESTMNQPDMSNFASDQLVQQDNTRTNLDIGQLR